MPRSKKFIPIPTTASGRIAQRVACTNRKSFHAAYAQIATSALEVARAPSWRRSAAGCWEAQVLCRPQVIPDAYKSSEKRATGSLIRIADAGIDGASEKLAEQTHFCI
jgi:hypothetical protein